MEHILESAQFAKLMIKQHVEFAIRAVKGVYTQWLILKLILSQLGMMFIVASNL
jgi:hypothetical protein